MAGINVSRWLAGGLAAGILTWLMEGAASALYMSAMIDALEPHGLAVDTTSAGIRWKVANADCSSRVTGSSVFDFDGDGNAEVIYNDE